MYDGYEVIASLPESQEIVTYVRFNFANGSQVIRFVVFDLEELVDFVIDDQFQIAQLIQLVSATTFVAFNMEALMPQEIIFTIDDAGQAQQLVLPDGTVAIRES